ncbi:hypothetical protein [Pseudemcibacter aquimaris]|uniref:hypothetical protein n=1 Tax=Pseudemcibacter aquimaris TaxID=2857064 RepID=UPI0020116524|nr:hypothetical protein [Pseudemcibacter aquimaris]MCC3860169.1 hypothetical protein [Pseudemcibacter aquimaris]WDU57496.1 hypothetical protein KW060_09840 [Pseudemcibacter aquimaris]
MRKLNIFILILSMIVPLFSSWYSHDVLYALHNYYEHEKVTDHASYHEHEQQHLNEPEDHYALHYEASDYLNDLLLKNGQQVQNNQARLISYNQYPAIENFFFSLSFFIQIYPFEDGYRYRAWDLIFSNSVKNRKTYMFTQRFRI